MRAPGGVCAAQSAMRTSRGPGITRIGRSTDAAPSATYQRTRRVEISTAWTRKLKTIRSGIRVAGCVALTFMSPSSHAMILARVVAIAPAYARPSLRPDERSPEGSLPRGLQSLRCRALRLESRSISSSTGGMRQAERGAERMTHRRREAVQTTRSPRCDRFIASWPAAGVPSSTPTALDRHADETFGGDGRHCLPMRQLLASSGRAQAS